MSLSFCQFRSASLLGVCSFAAVLLSGCSTNSFLASGPAAAATHGMAGAVHGGQQPVTGSTITLFSVGTTGYGSTLAMGTTDTSGNFNLGTITCNNTSDLVYITATGGNPGLSGTVNNSKIALASVLGTCGSLTSSTTVSINEVSTVAAAFALGQYFSATADSFGAPATTQAQVGIANAFATFNNLVSFTSGTAVQSLAKTSSLGTLTATPEYLKLNTIADILANCVNSDGTAANSNCATIFADVTPTGGTTPTDTLQAAVLFSLNPTSANSNGSAANLTQLFGFVSGSAPFTAVSAQPTDWTLGIQYSAGSSSTQTLINGANYAWVCNRGNGSLSEFTSAGAVLSPVTTTSGSTTTGVVGFVHAGIGSATGVAVDASGNVWVADGTTTAGATSLNSVFELVGAAAPAVTPLALAVKNSAVGVKP